MQIKHYNTALIFTNNNPMVLWKVTH